MYDMFCSVFLFCKCTLLLWGCCYVYEVTVTVLFQKCVNFFLSSCCTGNLQRFVFVFFVSFLLFCIWSRSCTKLETEFVLAAVSRAPISGLRYIVIVYSIYVWYWEQLDVTVRCLLQFRLVYAAVSSSSLESSSVLLNLVSKFFSIFCLHTRQVVVYVIWWLHNDYEVILGSYLFELHHTSLVKFRVLECWRRPALVLGNSLLLTLLLCFSDRTCSVRVYTSRRSKNISTTSMGMDPA